MLNSLLATSTIIGIIAVIAVIAVIAITIAICFYILSPHDGGNKKDE